MGWVSFAEVRVKDADAGAVAPRVNLRVLAEDMVDSMASVTRSLLDSFRRVYFALSARPCVGAARRRPPGSGFLEWFAQIEI